MFANLIAEFENLTVDQFAKYVSLSAQIGGLVKEQALLVKQAVDAQRSYIELASRSQKPSNGQLMELLKPTSELITKIQAIRDKNRKDEQFNHLSAVAEGITAFGWVTVAPTPGPFVKEMTDAAQFYTNKVLVTYKEKDVTHINWARAWMDFLSELQKYVRKNHTTGLMWNSKGSVVSGTNGSAGAPPPPPPPAAGFFDDISGSQTKSSANDSRAALFASINQGTGITQALRKVDSDQMTHKNPSLRQSSVVPDRKVAQSVASGGVAKTQKVLPPKFELEGKKWVVENHKGNANLVVDDTNMSQSVNVFNCQDSMLVVKGKVNSITVNQCKKFSLVFDNIVSVVEFIDSQRLQTQVTGVVPTITVDKVDGIEVYLSKDSLDCEIISSKSSEINVSVQNSLGDFVEHPLPEQLKTIWDVNSKCFKTIALEKN